MPSTLYKGFKVNGMLVHLRFSSTYNALTHVNAAAWVVFRAAAAKWCIYAAGVLWAAVARWCSHAASGFFAASAK